MEYPKRAPEVSLFKSSIFEDGTGEVAVVKDGATQIAIGKVHIL